MAIHRPQTVPTNPEWRMFSIRQTSMARPQSQNRTHQRGSPLQKLNLSRIPVARSVVTPLSRIPPRCENMLRLPTLDHSPARFLSPLAPALLVPRTSGSGTLLHSTCVSSTTAVQNVHRALLRAKAMNSTGRISSHSICAACTPLLLSRKRLLRAIARCRRSGTIMSRRCNSPAWSLDVSLLSKCLVPRMTAKKNLRAI